MKKIFTLTLIITSQFYYAQTKQDTINNWFKFINKQDQSYLKIDYIRNDNFLNNFRILNEQFTQNNLKNSVLNSFNKKVINTVNSGISCTFTHILQTKPELILNNDYIEFIECQIQKNDFDPNRLKYAMANYYYNMNYYKKFQKNNIINDHADEIQHQYDELFYLAMKKWGIQESDFSFLK